MGGIFPSGSGAVSGEERFVLGPQAAALCACFLESVHSWVGSTQNCAGMWGLNETETLQEAGDNREASGFWVLNKVPAAS